MIDRINGRLALLLAAAAVLLIVLVGWYALVSPQRAKAAVLEAQIGDAQVKLAGTQRFLRSSSGRRSAAQLRRLRLAIPDDVEMSSILRQLSWAAGRSGVRIDSIAPGGLVATSGGQALPISLTVAGHYFALGKFMHLLRVQADVSGGKVHASGRLYAIDSITFGSGDTKKGLITATLSLDAFVYAAAVPAPAVTGATGDGTTTTSTDETTTTAP
jgi:hypothetical protein